VVSLSDLDHGGSFTKSQLGAILDFWTEGDKPDHKASGSRVDEHNNLRTEKEMINHEPGSKNLCVIGSVIPHSRWTARRLHILQNFIPQKSMYLVPPSDGSHECNLKFSANGFPMKYSKTSAVTSGLLFSSLFR
jgi:hypothetical protein